MRSFPILYLIVFLLFYTLITVGAFRNIVQLVSKKRIFKWIFWIYTALLLFFFIFLYIYPNQPRHATNYPVYFYFNSILFLDFIFKIPLSFTVLFHFLFRRKKQKTILFTGLLISVGLAAVMIYGILFGQRNLKITEVELELSSLPKNFNNYKIVQISDIHVGSFLKSNPLLKNAKERILEINPDVLLFTGDLVNNFANELNGWEPIFKEMTANQPSFSILGNHDYGDYTTWETPEKKQENFMNIVNAEKNIGFRLLRNENAVLKKGADSLFLVGVENWGHPPFPQYADLDKAMKNVPNDVFIILMSHDPAHWESKIRNNAVFKLTLSGHTHGLQWGVKPAGIPFSLAYLIRKNWGGIYNSAQNLLYVNTGIGTVGVPWRIDMRPELTLITLNRSEVN